MSVPADWLLNGSVFTFVPWDVPDVLNRIYFGTNGGTIYGSGCVLVQGRFELSQNHLMSCYSDNVVHVDGFGTQTEIVNI